MRKSNKNRTSITKYVVISIFVLALSVVIAALTNIVLSAVYPTDEPVEHIVGMLEGVIGAVAAGLVLYQLKLAQKTEQHENEINEATFTLQYNQAFIQDPNMVEVERLLEDQVYYDSEPRQILNPENRQKFINYLVYLESMAPLVTTGVLALEYIDDLFAYRFFLAIDNKELQENEILPFADYYRGCFKLYKKWEEYRRKRGLLCPKDNCKNKDAMRALHTWENFDKYSS